MKTTALAGRILFGVALAGFGLLHWTAALAGIVPGAIWMPLFHWLLGPVGILLLAAGAAISLGKQTRAAAAAVALLMALRIVILDLPAILAAPRNGALWTQTFEMAGMMAVCLALVSPRLFLTARVLFAASLEVFAVQHFLYSKFVVMLIPGWIPAPYFFAWLVGVAFIASALAIAGGRAARAACLTLAAMFFTWVVILHIPRALHAPGNGVEWTGVFTALAFGAGSLIFAEKVGG
jgi:uncharacterized membrane protein YphA (DoxX/SURF4 family)